MSLRMRSHLPLSLLLTFAVAVSTGCGQGSKASADGPRAASGGANGGESSCIPPAYRPLAPTPPPPKELSAALESGIAASFAIFRRGPLESDKPPGLHGAPGRLSEILSKYYELATYYPTYVRRLIGSRRGEPAFVVPAFARPEAVPSARCFPTGVHALLVEQERRRSVEPVYCIIEAGSGGTRPLGCEPFAQVDTSFRAFHASDFLNREPTIEMVPDGVAFVRITYRDASPLTVLVVENAFVFTPPPSPNDRLAAYLRALLPKHPGEHVTPVGQLAVTEAWNKAFVGAYPIRIEWLDSGRKVMRSINPPTQMSTAATDLGDLRAPLRG